MIAADSEISALEVDGEQRWLKTYSAEDTDLRISSFHWISYFLLTYVLRNVDKMLRVCIRSSDPRFTALRPATWWSTPG